VCIHDNVGDRAALAIEALASTEPPYLDAHATPVHFDRYREILAAEGLVVRCVHEMIWTFPERLEAQDAPGFTLVASDTVEGTRFLGRIATSGMPEPLASLGFKDANDLWAPWCLALRGDDPASIAFSARHGPSGTSVGVVTVPGLRGRGLAAAVTAEWATLPALRGRTLFYSTSRANGSSQRVVARLGLGFVGASLDVL
jgi:hypothetical protein